MSSPNLRVVTDDNPKNTSSVPQNPPITPGEAFDPLLDLGEIELEDNERRHLSADNINETGTLQGMLRPILFAAGGTVGLIVAVLLFLKLSASSDTATMPPAISAKVDVLEAAMDNAVSTGQSHQNNHTVTPEQVPAENLAVVPALPATDLPAAPPVATPEPPPEPEIPHALVMEMSATVSSVQEIIGEIRATIADQQDRVGAVQAALAQLQDSTVEDRAHIDRLSRDMADIRRAVTEASAAKTREMQAMQRQLAVQRKAAKELQQAAPKVRPGFQLASVTQWGEDALATMSFNGQLQVLGKGDVLDGWTVVRIEGNTVTVVRAADGASVTLVKGA